MDPTYTTSDPNQLYMTDSGFAMPYDPTTDPLLVDPAVVPTVYSIQDVGVAPAPDATLPAGVTDVFSTFLRNLSTNVQRVLSPTVPTTTARPGLNLGSPMTLLVIGGIAYFLLRKR